MEPVRLPSHCELQTSSESHAALLEAFRTRDEIEIDTGGVERADLTAVQLLASAAKSAEALGKPMRLVAVSEPMRAALARAGLSLSRSEHQPHQA